MEHDREERTEERRFIDRNKSRAAKKGWKRHHASMMRGVRERERNMENKTFYGVTNDLEEMLDETKILPDGELHNDLNITFEFISGGFSAKLNEETGDISMSVNLRETGSGCYNLEQTNLAQSKQIFKDIRQDLQNLCDNFDKEIKQLLARYGLKSTK